MSEEEEEEGRGRKGRGRGGRRERISARWWEIVNEVENIKDEERKEEFWVRDEWKRRRRKKMRWGRKCKRRC